MNTYNDNLHSSVVASLQSQQTDLRKTQAILTAAKFSLFYAEGAKITAEQKLTDDTVVYKFQQQVKEQAVLNNNLAINIDGTAQDQKAHTALSVTNTSVAAANVQIASNAILRLASNIGSIYSIVSAADFDTEIYLQSKEANRLMGITAYEAERTSQLAMEAASLTAEVSSSKVAEISGNTKKSVANLLGVALNDFNTISTKVATDNADLSKASDTEKKAEGEVEYKNTDFFAAQSAFVINNRELNLDLRVTKNETDDSFFDVAFDFYRSPFMLGNDEKSTEIDTNQDNIVVNKIYPVKSYYIMVVKDSNKSIFSISNAEAVLLNPDRYVQVNLTNIRPDQKNIREVIATTDLYDTDGDSIQFGTKYVVFVMAVLLEEYKKIINNFDDYLTAASNTFILTNTLPSPEPQDIKISKEPGVLEFHLVEDSDFDIEYRCILLPDNIDQLKELLTANGLRSLEAEVEELEKIADKFVPPITKLKAEMNTYISQLEAIQNDQKHIRKSEHLTTSDKADLKKKHEANVSKNKEIASKLSAAKKKLAQLQKEQEAAVKKLLNVKKTAPGFYFDINIAESISFGNYTIAHSAKAKEGQKEKNNGETSGKNGAVKHLQVHFSADTNDAFGNRINNDSKYIPAILSVSTAVVENQVQFTNALSDFEKTKSISKIIPQ